MKKIIHLCYSAYNQTAAFRLSRSLESNGFESRIITGAKSTDDISIIQPKSVSERFSAIFGLGREFFYKAILYSSCRTYFSSNLGPLLFQRKWFNKLKRTEASIIHLHWIGNGFIPISNLKEFRKPIVWTIHDFWPITGGCHVAGSCNKFESQCGSCPQLFSTRKRDLTYFLFKRKRRIYKHLNLTIVVPSTWMESLVKKSCLLKDFSVYRIPNAVDTSLYKPLEKSLARKAFGLPDNKKILAFGSVSGTSDPNKGFDLLKRALEVVKSRRSDILMLVFGGHNSSEKTFLGYETKYIGRLSDDYSLVLLYSAADIVVVPSRQESFSQVSSESFACGTPVIAFDSTGPKDIIDHKENGYLARPYDPDDLAEGILWTLEDENRLKLLGIKARDKAILNFSYDVVSRQHINVYNKILNQNDFE